MEETDRKHAFSSRSGSAGLTDHGSTGRGGGGDVANGTKYVSARSMFNENESEGFLPHILGNEQIITSFSSLFNVRVMLNNSCIILRVGRSVMR